MKKDILLYCLMGLLAALFVFSLTALIFTIVWSPGQPSAAVTTNSAATSTDTAPIVIPTTTVPPTTVTITVPGPTEPQLGWVTIDGKTYYNHPDNNGLRHTGWLLLDGKRYYMDETGVRQTGWIRTEKGRFYLDGDGVMCTGWITLDGKRHYLQSNGILANGWLETPEGRLYLDENGTPTVGWLYLPEGKYHMNPEGIGDSGWFAEDGKTYYLQPGGLVHVGWLETQSGKAYLDPEGVLVTGWIELEGMRYYIGHNGLLCTGWQVLDGKTYYLGTDGAMVTGWQSIEEKDVYFHDDGSLAQGKTYLDGEICYFSSTGQQILLVNPWNSLPDGYSVEVIKSYDNYKVARQIDAALRKMMKDCKAAGFDPKICSGYRTHATQTTLYNNKVNNLMKKGYSRAEAEIEAAKHVAIPGTSEHQLGLAVDIVDRAYQHLDEEQAKRPTQKWLMENSWKYGFILRYPPEKTDITGIIYEPWHYRYVGLELAAELHELDMCLEEYLDMLTNDGTSCGGLGRG